MGNNPDATAKLARTLGAQRGKLLRGSAMVAVAGLLVAVIHAALAANGAKRFALAYLAAVAFVLSLSLGALFFLFIQHLTRAGWSVLLRRLLEAMAANMIVVGLLLLPVIATVAAGSTLIYPWSVWHVEHQLAPEAEAAPAGRHEEPALPHDSHAVAANHAEPAPAHDALPAAADHQAQAEHGGYPHQQLDELTLRKRVWLNPGLFLLRWALYLGLWAWLGWRFWQQSRLQDREAGIAVTLRCESLAAPAALLYAITITLAANDLLASLNPHWYSSIFGVYYFSGSVVGALALLILVIVALQRMELLTRAIGVDHLHDLGKFLFAFVFFWAYIAYSQYMLLWYAHMPETVGWLVQRGASTVQPNGWSIFLIVLALGHFAFPFALLMSRHVKRRAALLAAGAIWMLLMHWLDLIWLVMPELGPSVALGGVEIGLLLAVSSVYIAGLVWVLAKAPLVPINDPRLHESLAFENI